MFLAELSDIKIPEEGDSFIMAQVKRGVHNIVTECLWLDKYGTMVSLNRTETGCCMVMYSTTKWATTLTAEVCTDEWKMILPTGM